MLDAIDIKTKAQMSSTTYDTMRDFVVQACDEIETLRAEKEIYRKYWLELCEKILNELDKDGWCRLSMTREEAIEMKKIFEDLK